MHDGTDRPPIHGPPLELSARRRGLNRNQAAVLIIGLAAAAAGMATVPRVMTEAAVHGLWLLFIIAGAWRVSTVVISGAGRPAPPPLCDDPPSYASSWR